MRLLSLQLQQFRNYSDQTVDFSGEDVHLLMGRNGSGKTNLLEAVSVLSLTQSCLHDDEEDLRQWGTDFYRVRAKVQSDDGTEKDLEIVSQVQPRKAKACFVNDVKTLASGMVGSFPTVLFLPQDLELFTGPPQLRRRFLDTILSQVSPAYFELLSQYGKLLKQRNALLRRIADRTANITELESWNSEIAPKAAAITIARLELIETFGLTLAEEVKSLGETWTDVRILYDRPTTKRSEGELTVEILQMYAAARDKDILLQTTSVGPHRDDWLIEADGHSLHSSASRGQQRVCIVALLLLEASYLEIRRGEKPVILLDDVFSELDTHHQEKVLHSLKEHQVLITALHLPGRLPQSTVWNVSSGTVTESSPAQIAAIV